MRLYLDASPVIYTVEHVSPYSEAVDARLSIPEVVRIASDLTRMECRIKPLREGNIDLLRDYDDFFREAVSQIIALSSDVIDRATSIRAQYGFRIPDAIHLAAAVMSKCDIFLTNDQQLGRFRDIPIEIIQP